MKKMAFAVLSISILVVASGVPLLAQTVRFTANIPFAFVVGNKTLPAGEYWVGTGVSPAVVILKDNTEHVSALALTSWTDTLRTSDPAAAVKLIFNRYGDKYFLNQVSDGYAAVGMQLPISRTERELTKTASAATPQTVAVLAWRR